MSDELDLLGVLTQRIRSGIKAQKEAAADLEQVYREKLYRAQYPNFEQYCLEEFGISLSTGKRWVSDGRKMLLPVVSVGHGDPFAPEIEAPKGKAKAIETTATETEPGQMDRGQTEPQATLLQPTPDKELAEARKKIVQLEKALDVRLAKPAKPDEAMAAKLEALEVENQLLKAELERDDVPPVVTADGVSADFMAELAQALEMSVDHPPATLLAKVKALMDERAKRKPAKKAAPQEPEPIPSNVTPIKPIKGRCAVHPKTSIRVTSVGKFCEECQTLVRHTEKVG